MTHTHTHINNCDNPNASAASGTALTTLHLLFALLRSPLPLSSDVLDLTLCVPCTALDSTSPVIITEGHHAEDTRPA